ncbi:hypothetical protein [Natronorubrum halophilum]|uniref:hypothetical protein n=1 Tax=Natronorubrum halophilum TaxID=1702106 RepID=UPI000EF6E081|nr:hypothetical protein [Natronorubrum halophilum]
MAQIPTVVERLERLSRRRLLRSSGAAGGVLFAGCLGTDDTSDDETMFAYMQLENGFETTEEWS